MRIINDRRPMCDICSKHKADYIITVIPFISQFAGSNETEVYLCARDYRLLLNAYDQLLNGADTEDGQ